MLSMTASSVTGVQHSETLSRLDAMRNLLHSRELELERFRSKVTTLLDGKADDQGPVLPQSASGPDSLRIQLQALSAKHAAQSAELEQAEQRAQNAEKSVDELERRVAEMDAQLREGEQWTLEAHARARDSIIADLTARLQDLEARTVPKEREEDLEAELEATKRASSSHQRRAEELEARLSASEARAASLERAAEERQAARARLSETEARLGEEERRAAGLREQLLAVQNSLAEARGNIQTKEVALRRHAQRAKEVEKELETLRQRMIQHQISQAARTGVERASAVHARAAAVAAEERCHRVEGLSERGRRELENALAAAEQRVRDLESQCSHLGELVQRLQSMDALTAGRALKCKLDTCATELHGLRAEHAETLAGYEASHQRESSLREEIARLQVDLVDSKEQLAASQQEVQGSRQLAEELEAARNATFDASRHIKELQKSHQHASMQLKRAEAQLLDATRQAQRLESHVDELEGELKRAETAFQALQSDASHKDTLLKLADEHRQAEQQRMRAALESTAREVETMQTRCQALSRERGDHVEEVESLRKALEKQSAEMQTKVAELEQAERIAHSELEEKRTALSGRLQALESQLEARDAGLACLQEKLEMARNMHAEDVERLKQAHENEMDILQEENRNAQQLARLLQMELKTAREHLKSAHEEKHTPSLGQTTLPHHHHETETPTTLTNNQSSRPSRENKQGLPEVKTSSLYALKDPQPITTWTEKSTSDSQIASDFEELLSKLEDVSRKGPNKENGRCSEVSSLGMQEGICA